MRPRIIALAAFALAAPATAQDGSETAEKRTVEGAQQFLAEFYERGVGRAETAGYESGSEWRWQEAPGFTFQLIDGVVDSLRPVGRCKSVITISSAIKKKWRSSDAIVSIAGGRPIELEIDWSSLSSVKVRPDWLYEEGGSGQVPSGLHEVSFGWKGGWVFLRHADKADAERVGFVIQFLKEECGFKTETGF
jgi:hypothetical protein